MTKDRLATRLARSLIVLILSCGSCLAQNIITTFAGTGFCGFSGDGGPAISAQLCTAQGPAVDASGNVYFEDHFRIRMVNTAGIITTIAGTGNYGTGGDGGPALSANLGWAYQLAVNGNFVCFGDSAENKIRCVNTSSGVIVGYGTGVSGTGGDGGSVANASFIAPEGVAFDNGGNLYISDFGANSVRRVDNYTGIITTIAGPGPGYSGGALGDGGPAVGADLYEPMGIAYYNGAIYIADTGNSRIRRVDLATGIITSVNANGSPLATNSRWIALDLSGDLFLSAGTAIQEVDTNGNLATIAGTLGISGAFQPDVPATQTYFGGTRGIAWDNAAHRLLINDNGTTIAEIFYTPATTTTLTPSANPAVPGGQVTLEAAVTPVTATGTVRFYQNITLLGSAPVTNGVAQFTWTAPLGGFSSYTLRAVYEGDLTDNLSASSITENVGQGSTTTSLSSSPNPSGQGQNVIFTATVSPVAATGTVYLMNGSTQLGSATLSNGVATFNISSLPTGSTSIRANYTGSVAYLSSSGTITQVVLSPTTASLTATPNPSAYGSAVTLTASVMPAAATGTAQFFSGSTLLGSAALASGQAQISVNNLAAGSDSLTAVYSGDSTYAGSTSAAWSQSVKVATVPTLASTMNPTYPQQAISIIVTVTPSSNIGPTPTGSVQLLDGTTVLGTSNLQNGTVQFSVSFALGTHSLTAVYAGDANFLGSTSAVLSEVVKNLSSGYLTSSANPSMFATPITFTTTVYQPGATGSVQFLDYGSGVNNYVVIGTSPLVNNVATFTTSTLSAGTHNIVGSYLGDATYLGFNSSYISQVVTGPSTGLITTIAGTGTAGTAGVGGPATSAQLSGPYGMVVDSSDNMYVVDGPNNRVVRIDAATGALTLVAGNGTASSAGDSGLATQASLNHPIGVALDAAGNLFISEMQGQRIRRVDATTGIITTMAGSGVAGWSGDGGSAASAQLASPMGIATDAAGNLYIADAGNARIRRIDAQTGIITTVAGNGAFAFTPDGVAASGASLAQPQWVSVDQAGNLLVSEWASARIRSINASTGLLSTVAGNGSSTFTGDGIAATSAGIGSPQANVAADASGNLFFSDGSGRIRRVDAASGIITTVAGNGSGAQGILSAAGPSVGSCFATPIGDNGPATNATLDGPGAVGLTKNGNLVFSDWLDCRVRRGYLPSPYPYTATSLTASAATITAGQSVTLTATVAPIGTSGVPTGTIQFVDAPAGLGSTVLGSAQLSGGAASLAVGSLQANGAHQIVAYYSGDASFNGSGSPRVPITVKPPLTMTTTSVSAPSGSSTYSQTVTFTATVTPAAATGTVQFFDGGTSLGTASLSGGTAALSVSTLSVGTHSITASYSGDTGDATSTSAAWTQTVGPATTSTTVVSSVNPSASGQSVTLTATVALSGATGTIQFLDGATSLGTVPLSGTTASLSTAALVSGSHNITAVYSGDANYSTSTSPVLVQTVKFTTTTALSSSGSSIYGQNVLFTVWVTPTTATGSIQFLDGTTVLGTVALSGGTATLQVSSLAAGTHSVTAMYGGDGADSSSTSAVLTQNVAKGSLTVTLAASPSPAFAGQTVTLTASGFPSAATGTVQFLDGSTVLATASVASGIASMSTNGLAPGIHSLTAVYSGDTNFNGATSAAFSEAVQTPTVTSFTANNATVTAGTTVVFTAVVSPSGATGTVQFKDGSIVLASVPLSNGSAVYSTSMLAIGTHPMYAVYSGDATHVSSTSTVVVETVNPAPPAPPTNLIATSPAQGQIMLNWTASSTSGVVYNVYGSTTPGFAPAAGNRIVSGISGTSFAIGSLSPSITYYYLVTAIGPTGESVPSNQASAMANGVACHVTYTVTSQSTNNFSAAMTMQNIGSKPIHGWNLTWTWPGNQQIYQSSNSNFKEVGPNATLTNLNNNANINPGQTISGIGFNAAYGGTNPAPTGFYVNGTQCQ